KAEVEDIPSRITAGNRYPKAADLTVLPTLWVGNLRSFHAIRGADYIEKRTEEAEYRAAGLHQPQRGHYHYYFERPDRWLFTENETNTQRLYHTVSPSPYVKDLFHDMVLNEDYSLMENKSRGTKFSPLYQRTINGGESVSFKMRLSNTGYLENPLLQGFDQVFDTRKAESDEFFRSISRTKDQELFQI